MTSDERKELSVNSLNMPLLSDHLILAGLAQTFGIRVVVFPSKGKCLQWLSTEISLTTVTPTVALFLRTTVAMDHPPEWRIIIPCSQTAVFANAWKPVRCSKPLPGTKSYEGERAVVVPNATVLATSWTRISSDEIETVQNHVRTFLVRYFSLNDFESIEDALGILENRLPHGTFSMQNILRHRARQIWAGYVSDERKRQIVTDAFERAIKLGAEGGTVKVRESKRDDWRVIPVTFNQIARDDINPKLLLQKFTDAKK